MSEKIKINQDNPSTSSIIGTSLQAAGTLATNIADAAVNANNIKNADQYKQLINQTNQYQSKANTISDWINEYSNLETIDPLSKTAFRMSPSELGAMYAKHIGSGAASGAAVGGLFSGVGAGIGAGAGALTGLITAGASHISNFAKARKTEKILTPQYQNALIARNNTMNAKANSIETMNQNTMLNNWSAEGGPLHTQGGIFGNGLTFFNTGGTHEQNPNEGILQGYDNEGVPNMVEEGEVKYNNYIFSNRLKAKKEDLQAFNLPDKYEDKTYADIAKILSKESEERPNDPISKKTLDNHLNKLTQAQETFKQRKEEKKLQQEIANNPELQQQIAQELMVAQMQQQAMQEPQQFWAGGKINKFSGEDIPSGYLYVENPETKGFDIKDSEGNIIDSWKPESWKNISTNFMQYMPVLGSAIGTVLAAKNPDYTDINTFENRVNNLGYISYTPVGTKMKYNPYDINLATNKLQADHANTINNLINTSGGNAATARAGILLGNYQNQLAIGDAYRDALLYNDQLKQQVLTHNNAVDQANAEKALQVAQINADIDQAKLGHYYNTMLARQGLKDARDAAISSSLTTLFENMGQVGNDIYTNAQINASGKSGMYGEGYNRDSKTITKEKEKASKRYKDRYNITT